MLFRAGFWGQSGLVLFFWGVYGTKNPAGFPKRPRNS
jgi:hypothetical protein